MSVEYPALLSTVDWIGIVGFILTLKGQVFSLNLYKQSAKTVIGVDVNEDCVGLSAVTESGVEDSVVIEYPEIKKERPDDLPDDVPAKATIMIKEINDNRYYHWQWQEGEKIRSQYKGPVNPDE